MRRLSIKTSSNIETEALSPLAMFRVPTATIDAPRQLQLTGRINF
jgi:hypothetical protein